MYKFYLDRVLLPNTPSKLTTKIGNMNKSYELANGGEINLIKKARLTEYEFDFELTHSKGFTSSTTAKTVLDLLEDAKANKKIIQFQVVRKLGNKNLFPLQANVTVEDYTIVEDAENRSDMTVTLVLKHFKTYRTKHLANPEKQRPKKPKEETKKVVKDKEGKVIKTDTKAIECLKQLEIKTDLNIRSGAGTHNRKVSLFKKGERPYAYASYNLDGKTWYKVKHSKGDKGFAWISGNTKYVKVIKDFKKPTATVESRLNDYNKGREKAISARPSEVS